MSSDQPVPPSSRSDSLVDRAAIAPGVWDDDGTDGVYRRRIRCINDPHVPGRTTGELEDDFHHFRVVLEHSEGVITGAHGSGVRVPWSTCMDAGVKLAPLVGRPVSSRSTAVGDYADARQNCTHMFDLAGLVVAHAARDEAVRQYDFEVTDRTGDPPTSQARAWRNGQLVLEWHLVDNEIAAPAGWVGAPIHRKFIAWAESNRTPDEAEAAIALKRIVNISLARGFDDLDGFDRASELGSRMQQRCHTFQPGVAVVALRQRRSARDFTDHPELLLTDMHLR